MFKNKIIWIKIEVKNFYDIFIKLSNIGITIFDNKKLKNCILIKTTYDDYKRIKKYLVSYKISIYSNSGIKKIEEISKKYFIFLLSVIFGIILLICVNNMIFKVEVKSNDLEIQKLLIKELNDYGLGKLKFKKNHKKVEKIVDNILDNNKDIIEWLEIKYDGLVMVVNVTEKTKTENHKKYKNCNIIAKKDAKIISLKNYRGITLKDINDYVLKDDVILSGEITQNEEVKNTVCADGLIYGEVWYKVRVTIPFQEEIIKYTNKNRYNLSIKLKDDDYLIFKSRLQNKENKKINLYKLKDFEINLIKEQEYKKEIKKLSEQEAFKKGIDNAIDKIQLKLNKDEEILEKKVLKKQLNNSTIYLEIFIVTKESIGMLQVVEDGV